MITVLITVLAGFGILFLGIISMWIALWIEQK
jgi:hypothetical protein